MGSRLSKKKRTIRRARASPSMRVAWLQHPLGGQQLAAARGRVRSASSGMRAPQQIRQPHGHLVAARTAQARPVAIGHAQLDPVQEVGRLQQRLDHRGHGAGEAGAGQRARRPVQRQQPVGLARRQRPAEGPGRQPLDDGAGAGLLAGGAGLPNHRRPACPAPPASGWRARRCASATLAYCSASRLETDWAAASLPKPLPDSSAGSVLAGEVVSPSRSRTVLLYSKRVSRRSGAGPGLMGRFWQAAGMVGPWLPGAEPGAMPGPIVPGRPEPPVPMPGPMPGPGGGRELPPPGSSATPEQPRMKLHASATAGANRLAMCPHGVRVKLRCLRSLGLASLHPRVDGSGARRRGRRRQS